MTFDSRMCSRLLIGSASRPSKASNPDTTVATEFDTGEQYGFAVAKGQNDKLLKTVDDIIASSKKNGEYDKIYKKYFGEAPQQ